jgi:O-antigen ligase
MRGLIGVLVVASIVIPFVPDAFWNRIHTMNAYQEERDQSALGRLHFWQVAIEMGNANPLLGIGFNGYNPTYDAYDSSGGEYGRGRSVHSSFLGVLAEIGYPGLALYVLIIFGALRTCFVINMRTRQRANLSDINKGALALEVSLVAFVIGGSFVPFQYNEMLWHITGLTIALERIAIRRLAQADVSSPPEPVGYIESRAQASA